MREKEGGQGRKGQEKGLGNGKREGVFGRMEERKKGEDGGRGRAYRLLTG